MILGIDLTSICDLPSIFDEAKNRCPAHMKKAWDMVFTTSFWSIWLSRSRKVFDDVEIPVQIAVGKCMDMCKLWAHRAKKHEKVAFQHRVSEWPDR
jgi:hypothetical protein